ncbi:MAG: cellulase family glycosylhydrolase [Firmicutes bacterium]|nr:cellulase family glycosylhydrolase [Bacillota bacterium]
MEKIKSVNLGGWFVLERWMKPTLFDDTQNPARCETSFVTNDPHAKEKLIEHWQTWITKEDIAWLKKQGINLVRIPIPWWLFPDKFPSEHPYHSPLLYLDKALDFIHQEGMKVMLDLHTAPGSQNGFDNGGIDGVMTWHLDPQNITTTISVLEEIAKRYKNHPALHSLQVLNEPHMTIDMNIIEDFYIRSYEVLRPILREETFIVFHDAFRFNHWGPFFQEHQWKNVILDTHVYQCFGNHFDHMDATEFLNVPFDTQQRLVKMEEIVPVVVGEWSLGARQIDYDGTRFEFEQRFAENQLKAFSSITGWIFWSYKISDYLSGWNFRGLVERGILKF